jgi:hypothetical protein
LDNSGLRDCGAVRPTTSEEKKMQPENLIQNHESQTEDDKLKGIFF